MEIGDILKDLERNVNDGRSSRFNLLEQKQQDFAKLNQTWISERTAPELLPYQKELVDSTLVRLRDQVEIIEINSIELETTDADIKLKLLIIENEIERINFIIRSYLRCRLAKIDKFAAYISYNSQTMIDRLSDGEIDYMTQHMKLLQELYSKCFLQDLPDHLQLLDDTSGGISMITEPNFDKFVFIKVVTGDAKPVRFNDHEIVLEKDDIHTIQYKYIMKQLQQGDVVLI
ncbi:DNA replication protein [Saccharomycopsis crataegensis]|uniref:DNA replication complex GINS protein SLD5 n=1 Tax=Saccharomycopsis crataegensis TaxID=43959 RepID=A0AAV5QI92_9ASCO|nr:DNA replication protein [Saccharomycopsis crataegensis]